MSFLRCIHCRNRIFKSVYVELHVSQQQPVAPSLLSPSPPSSQLSVSSLFSSSSSSSINKFSIRIRPTSIPSLFGDSLASSYVYPHQFAMSFGDKQSKTRKTSSNNNESKQRQHQAFLSEGNHRCISPYEHLESNNNEQQQQHNETRFDFDWLNIRLLEKITFIGTAVAVGIDFRPRLHEYLSYRRGVGQTFNDYCHHHHHPAHHQQNVDANNNSNNHAGSCHTPLACAWRSSFVGPQLGGCAWPERDPSLTTLRFCGSCHICQVLFEKFFRVYLAGDSSVLPSSGSLSNLNLLPEGTSAPTGLKTADIDHGESRPTTSSESSGVETSSAISSIEDTNIVVGDQIDGFVSPFGSFQASLQTQVDDSETADDEIKISSLKIQDEEEPAVVIQDDKESEESINSDMARVFQQTSMEYADELNNLVAVSLMQHHRPHEAMDCWANCESSSKAFFNMGVAYESGLYDRNSPPDLNKAHDCYALAASMGHPLAIYNLSLFYLYGKGKVAQNVTRGLELLELAASKGVQMAKAYVQQHKALSEEDDKEEEEEKARVHLSAAARRARYQCRPPSKSMMASTNLEALNIATGKKHRRLHPHHRLQQGASILKHRTSLNKELKRHNSAPDLLMLTTTINAPSIQSSIV